ncbi:MAG: IS21-like element helper ATPase IstB [Candidatus Obscuribacterales bacterium]|nr:IS21-like element helper ATPase IstB [Candidatus Obscuribacterales bacterium]
MLIHPTIDMMKSLKLYGMARALETQLELKEARELSFEERLGMLLDSEVLDRENKRTSLRLKNAQLRLSACIEDIKIKPGRGLERAVITALATCDWIRDKRNILITGPTGAGKTYLACALANSACRQGYTVVYYRAPSLFDDLIVAKADGRYKRILASIESKKLLVLDDFGLEKLASENRRDMFEIIERRYDSSSTIISSQFPLEHWHDVIGDPTLADAILDRIVHNSHKLKVKGETMRDPKNQNG